MNNGFNESSAQLLADGDSVYAVGGGGDDYNEGHAVVNQGFLGWFFGGVAVLGAGMVYMAVSQGTGLSGAAALSIVPAGSAALTYFLAR